MSWYLSSLVVSWLFRKRGVYKLFVYRDGGVEEFSLPSGIQPISGFCCDRSAVCDEYYNYGYIDSEGNLVVPCRYERVNDYNEGLAVVEQNWRKGYVDTDGYEVSPVSYREAEMFRNGRGCVQNEAGLYGYVDETGREVIPCRFEKAISFYGEVTPACLNGLYGLIDKDGEFISTPRYEAMGICDVDVFYFYENGLYGFVDAEQKELTSARYDRIGELFSEGLIDVEQQGKHGFINKQGEEVIPCIYSRVSRFENGFARVARNGRVGVYRYHGDAKSFCSPLTAMRALIARATVCSVLKAVVRYSSLMRRVTGSTVTVGRLRVPSLLVVRHPPVVAWVVTWCLFPQFRHPFRRVAIEAIQPVGSSGKSAAAGPLKS